MIRRQAIFLRDTIQGFLVLDRDMLDIVQRDINASFDLVRILAAAKTLDFADSLLATTNSAHSWAKLSRSACCKPRWRPIWWERISGPCYNSIDHAQGHLGSLIN